MIFLIIFVYFTFYIAVNSEEIEKNAEKFDEFIDIVFDVSYSPPTDTHHQMTFVDYWKLENIVYLIQENISKPVWKFGDPDIHEIYHNFQTAMADQYKNEHEKVEKVKQFFENFDRTKQGKVQFMMLLLSFATRVAFTIGSKALERNYRLIMAGQTRAFPVPRPPTFPPVQTELFVLAYEKLENAFPIESRDENVKYRYYHGANLYPNENEYEYDDKMRFDFMKTHLTKEDYKVKDMRKFNFTKLRFFLQHEHRISHLIKVLALIDHFYAGFQNFSDVDIFFDKLLLFWGDDTYSTKKYLQVKIFALKTFGVNLANRIRRQPEAEAYFKKYPKAEEQLQNFSGKLYHAMKKHEKNMDINGKEMNFMKEQEMNMHYEDALKLDWHAKEEIYQNIHAKFVLWWNVLRNYKTQTDQSVKAILDEFNKNKALLESFMDDINNLNSFKQALEKFIQSRTQQNLDLLEKGKSDLMEMIENALDEEFKFEPNVTDLIQQKPPLYKRAYDHVRKMIN